MRQCTQWAFAGLGPAERRQQSKEPPRPQHGIALRARSCHGDDDRHFLRPCELLDKQLEQSRQQERHVARQDETPIYIRIYRGDANRDRRSHAFGPIRVVRKSELETIKGALDQTLVIAGHDHDLWDRRFKNGFGDHSNERPTANLSEKLILCAKAR